MIALLAATTMALDLQSPYNQPTILQYAVTIKADVGSEQHEAVFTFRIESLKSSGDKIPAKLSWLGLTVDGNETGEEMNWTAELDESGNLLKVEGEDDGLRRMLTPLMFSFPNRPVEEKAKFESTWLGKDAEFRPAFAGESVSSEKVGDKSLIKFTSKFSEKGDTGIRADGTWWFSDSGKLSKFELDAKNWVVPMAGPDLVSAKISAVLK